MKDKPSKFLESHRVCDGPLASNRTYGNNGAFEVPLDRTLLVIVASDREGWDHVSVHAVVLYGTSTHPPGHQQAPTWEQMDYVRKLFFRCDEWVIQYHAPTNKHVNDHPHTLHMWRPWKEGVPVPPGWMV